MNKVIFKSFLQAPNSSLREIYEYCSSELAQQKGKNAMFSLLVYANELLLRPMYNELMSNWYNEREDKDFMEYVHKRDLLILKHADRGNDGNVIYEAENRPRITENIVEFEDALNELNEASKDIIKHHDDSLNRNEELMNFVRNIPLFNMDPSYLPTDLPPRFVGYFASNSIKELFV